MANIRIVRTGELGKEPLWVKEAVVGLEFRNIPETTGDLGENVKLTAFDWPQPPQRISGFLVPVFAVLEALRDVGKHEVVRWWENVLTPSATYFLFPKYRCEVID